VDAALLSSDQSISFGATDIEPRSVSITMMSTMSNEFSSTPKAKIASQKEKPSSRSTKNSPVKSKVTNEKDIDTSMARLTAESVEEKVAKIS
jgi:hypothetical protein